MSTDRYAGPRRTRLAIHYIPIFSALWHPSVPEALALQEGEQLGSIFKTSGEEFRDLLVRHVFSDPSWVWFHRLYPSTFDNISASMKSFIRRNTIDAYISNQ